MCRARIVRTASDELAQQADGMVLDVADIDLADIDLRDRAVQAICGELLRRYETTVPLPGSIRLP